MDNALSDLEDYRIYLGTWTDWTRGRVLGATLTLTRQNATLLVAFIALFITMVSTSFWTLSCFALHHFFSSESARDGLHHQRQIILRNSANPISGISRLFWLFLAWRKIAKRSYGRILPLLLLSSLILAGFAACSGFSSKVSGALDGDVLLLGDKCGLFGRWSSQNVSEATGTGTTYQAERCASAANYALQCYTNKTSSENCQKYKKKQLPFSIHTNASCPFKDELCLSLDQNVLLDTGYLNTLDDFGINSPPDEQFLYRKVDHCAPLNLTGRQGHRTDHETGINYRTYYLGPRVPQESPFTYQYPEFDYVRLEQDYTTLMADYTLSVLNARFENGSYNSTWSFFHPIPELAVANTDIMLFFLSANGLVFVEPSNDLWYATTRDSSYEIEQVEYGTSQIWFQDDIVSVLGCTSRQQWCALTSSRESQCQPLRAVLDGNYEDFPIRNDKQRKIYHWLEKTIVNLMPLTSYLVATLGVSALTARFKVNNSIQGPIQDNQWQLEVQHWFSASMASVQDAFVANAAGAPNLDLRPDFRPPENPHEHSICTNQRIRSAAHMNFSIFGIAIIFSVGGLIIIASYTIEPFVAWLQRRRRLDSYSRLEWCTNETFQLQRLANEEIGLGVWDHTDETIPVTGRDDLLAVLDLTNPKHPRLKAPPVSYEEEFHVGSQKIADDSPEPGEADQDKIIREDIQETGKITMETQVSQDSEEDSRLQDLDANDRVSHR